MAANNPYPILSSSMHGNSNLSQPPSGPPPSFPLPSSSTGGIPQPPPSSLPPSTENAQPTVRVMRLYKPGFHLTSTLPYLPGRSDLTRKQHSEAAEFTLSSHLLLPDSFGDIYIGEKFSAYIGVVNGFVNIPFYNVRLTVRLQTATQVVDLADSRTGSNASSSLSNILGYNDSSEVVIQYHLSELGTHTLRVSVQYSLAYNAEIKTLRKFYRFNVLNPLLVLSSYMEVNQMPMVQCQVTNSTKSPIYLEEMTFVSRDKDAVFTPLHKFTKINDPKSELTNDDIMILQPDESYAFAFMCTFVESLVDRVAGYPLIKWCNSLGDTAVFRGDETTIKSGFLPTASLPQHVKGFLLEAPGVVFEDDTFEIIVRLNNSSNRDMPIYISCRNHDLNVYNDKSPDQQQSFIYNQNEDRASLSAPNISFNLNMEGQRGMMFIGLTSQYLGILQAGGSVELKATLYAVAEGLYDFPPILVKDRETKERYTISNLAKILIKRRLPVEETKTSVDGSAALPERQEEEELAQLSFPTGDAETKEAEDAEDLEDEELSPPEEPRIENFPVSSPGKPTLPLTIDDIDVLNAESNTESITRQEVAVESPIKQTGGGEIEESPREDAVLEEEALQDEAVDEAPLLPNNEYKEDNTTVFTATFEGSVKSSEEMIVDDAPTIKPETILKVDDEELLEEENIFDVEELNDDGVEGGESGKTVVEQIDEVGVVTMSTALEAPDNTYRVDSLPISSSRETDDGEDAV
eukprot:gene5019-5511_t